MVERREGTSTEGRGLGFSFAADNVDRGDPEKNQFIKRRPTFPLGDDPRGREINWIDQDTKTFRAYKGLVPIQGQDPLNPSRVIRIGSTKDLRPELPSQNVDTAALDAAKDIERAILLATDYGALFPTSVIVIPSAGDSFSPGVRIEIRARGTDIRSVRSATLYIDGSPVDRKSLPRGEQDSTKEHDFIFLYDIPATRALGTMEITVRVYDIETGAQGIILDDAINRDSTQPRGGVSSLDGRIGRLGSTSKTNPQLDIDPNQFLRTPAGVSTINVNII